MTRTRSMKNLVVAALLAVVVTAAAACSDTSPAETAAEPAAAGAPAPTAPAPAAPSAIAGLDAASIVAAQEQVLIELHDRLVPSIVQIRVATRVAVQQQDFFGQGGPQGGFQQAEGSGFVWDAQGNIVTNHHVIEGAEFVRVFFADGTELPAEIVGSDPDSDLAVIKVDLPPGTPPVQLGDSNALDVGQLAVAIGSPFGQDFTMTRGIVSALGRSIRSGPGAFTNPRVIQTDTPINPGNSGGPLLDREGRVIGITTQIISAGGGGSVGIGFAVPIGTAKRVVPALITDGEYRYAFLGLSGSTVRREVIEAMDLPPGTRGTIVAGVVEGGPADLAGLRGGDAPPQGGGFVLGGDVITAIDGAPITSMDDLIAYLAENTRPGDTVAFDVLRPGGEQTQVVVRLAERPDASQLAPGPR